MKTISSKEAGFVAIFSVMVIMAILTLVAVGFSNVTRRAQRRTLDNQLNTQAFYAAESGVNDAKVALAANPAFTKTTCIGQDAGNSFNYNLDNALNVGYTCLLINSQPGDLQFDSIPLEGTASPKVTAFESSTNTVIKSFDVTWDATGAAAGTAAIPIDAAYPNILTPGATWGNKLGMLRIDLAPTNALDRNALTIGSYTFFLYPSTAAGTATHTVVNGTGDQGGLVFVKCTAAVSPCKATINLSGSSSKYVMRLQALYNSVQAGISNVRDGVNGTGGLLTLQNGQSVVDVTGRAADVFRRIQVRLPAGINGFTPSFALQSADSICKRLKGSTGVSTIDTSNVSVADQDPSSGVCALTN